MRFFCYVGCEPYWCPERRAIFISYKNWVGICKVKHKDAEMGTKGNLNIGSVLDDSYLKGSQCHECYYNQSEELVSLKYTKIAIWFGKWQSSAFGFYYMQGGDFSFHSTA